MIQRKIMKMIKKIIPFLVLSAFLMTVSMSAMAKDHNRDEKSFQFQAMSTLFLGSGVSIGYHLFNPMYLGVENFGFTFDDDDDYYDEKTEFDFDTTQVLVRISPFSSSGFYIQAGGVSRTWAAQWTGTDIKNDGIATTNDYATIEVKWPDSGTNVGLGWTWIFDAGFSLNIALATISGDPPEVSIIEDGGGASAAELAAEEAELEDDLAEYKDVGYFAFSIGWNF
jgi:hypothetical protein